MHKSIFLYRYLITILYQSTHIFIKEFEDVTRFKDLIASWDVEYDKVKKSLFQVMTMSQLRYYFQCDFATSSVRTLHHTIEP